MSLGRLIKENFVLAVGLCLPVIMVAAFLLTSAIPRMITPAPQFSVVFSVQSYNSSDYNVRYFIDKDAIKAKVDKRGKETTPYYLEELYIYNPIEKKLRKIEFTPPSNAGHAEVTVESVKDLKVSTKETSPDGYQFSRHDRNRSGGLFFFDGGYREGYRLHKGAASYNIPDSPNRYGSNVKFLGWVKP